MLTPQQQQALTYGHHISVTANAGAGKTTVLINRFLTILLETRATVQQLVAITFTDKAASELRVKIAAQVNERLSVATGELRTRLEYIRDQLAGANIGTIHSFCAQLLREYPVEADIDAGFTILEGVDQQFLIDESYRESFEEMVAGGDTGTGNDLIGVLRRIGPEAVERYIKTFIQKREQTERLMSGPLSQAKSDEEILGHWNKLTAEYLSELLSDRKVGEILDSLLPRLAGTKARECSRLIGQFLGAGEVKEKASSYLKLTDILLTREGTIRKTLYGRGAARPGPDGGAGVLDEIRKKVVAVADGEESPVSANEQLLRMTKILLGLYQHVMERYTAKKGAAGQLDFDDLEFSALALLSNQTVRSALSAKYHYLMIDEFQDTNYLQYEILQRLVAGFAAGNLFIVGDPKQSIYGFRNAEVEIFERSKSDIGRANEGGFSGNVILNESFRLVPAIADFINRVFSATMSLRRSSFDVGYEELISARGIAAEGKIDFFLVPRGWKDGPGGDPVAVQCGMIAQHLKRFYQDGYPIHGRDNGAPRPFTYGDAAILVRQRTHLPDIERALTEYHIPYLLTGGIGYYQTQEIYDILNYLKFLINRDNDVALAGILRSPFFTISDSELFEISLEKGAETFWSKAREHVRGKSCSLELCRAVKILDGHIELANRVPIPVLIQKAVDDTGWAGIMNGLEHGSQSKANIDKLLHIANEFESRGFLSLFDFIERIKTLSQEEDREGQAAIEAATPSVHVMTIHAAKGLEFPLVVLPFLDKQFRYDQEPYLDPAAGIGFRTVDEEDFGRTLTPPVCNYLKERMNLKTEAEEKRIFYVATTRAMEHLVLTGNLGNLTRRPSYLRWGLEALGLPVESLVPGAMTLKPHPCKVLDRSAGNRIIEIEHPLTLEVTFPGGRKGHAPGLRPETKKNENPAVILPEIRLTRAEEYFSATQITTYLECPRKFYLRHVLGIPEIKNAPYNFDENEDAGDRLRGDIVGLATHKILEGIRDTGWTGEMLRLKIREAVGSFPSLPSESHSKYVEEVEHNLVRFLESDFGKKTLSAGGEQRTELSLTMVIGEDFLTGTIDKIVKNPKGEWEVLDYKTDTIVAGQIGERSEIYKPQLSVYSLLASRYFGQKEVEAVLIFLKHPERPVHFRFDGDALGEIQGRMEGIIKKIKEGNFPINQNSCPRCPYYLNGCLGK